MRNCCISPAHPLLAIVALLAMALPGSAPLLAGTFDIPDKSSPEMAWWSESQMTHDQRLEWWREARFGMFVHWGVYSRLGGTWQGQPVKGYAEHIQRMLKIPIPVYREQVAGRFNPAQFDADAWISAAKAAGMGYFIITAKHHDGFAMFDSEVSDYNVVKATPFHHDPMKDLQLACRKHGLKFGFYYSQAFDWGDANGPGNDWDYNNPGGDLGLHGGRNWWENSPEFVAKARRYVDEKSIPQLLELIRKYDPDILWFDTPHKLPPSENLRILKAVWEAKPRIVVNSRLVRGCGDYNSTADRPAEFAPHEGDWEGIPTTNESYGWNQNDHSHKPATHFIRLLAKAAARGGNLLMNIGPRGDGRIDPPDLEILRGIGQWWQVNGESIRGTTRTPLPVQAWGESTRKGSRLYLHVFQWPEDGKLVVGGLKSGVKKAFLLADKEAQPLEITRLNTLDICVHVQRPAPDSTDTVIVVDGDSEIIADSRRLLQPAFAEDTLRVFDGTLEGKTIRFGAGKTRDAFVYAWSNRADAVSWNLRMNDPAMFEVQAVFDAEAASAGNTFGVTVGTNSLKGTVKAGVMQSLALGQVKLNPGQYELRVTPLEVKSGELMRLRCLKLKPVMKTAATIPDSVPAIDVAAIDRERILKAAQAALNLEPITVTRFRSPLSQGGENDFYSNGDYWWPNPNTTNGLPYIQRDGQSNPDNFSAHRLCVMQLRDAVAALGAAYQVTGEKRYVLKAATLLKVFFVDAGTRMNPNLQYAQAIPGVSPGRGIGIIDTLHLAEVPLAVRAMEGSKAFPPEVLAGVKQWFRDYTEWMTTSKNGKDEANAGNNHAVAFWLQVACFSRLAGDESKLGECRRRFKEVFVPRQMTNDGSFPAELRRTKPYGYSIFQLDNMAALCQVASTPGDDLWRFQLPDGRGIEKAISYLYPYLTDKSKWPLKPDIQAWEGWPARQPCLLFAGLALRETKFLELWKQLPADPTDAEVRRNIAITQPVLWLDAASEKSVTK